MSGITAAEQTVRVAEPRTLEVSVVIPCLNEAASIKACVDAARRAIDDGNYEGEVVVVDNGSTDGSGEIAAAAGARVIHEPRRGYGNAYLAGLAAADGNYIVMLDADLTYDAAELPRFVQALEDGGDLVLGDRMESIHPGAMPWLHRHIGNPVLTGLLNRLFGTKVNDAHCGMRAIRRDVLPRLDLRTGGMELASEMVIRAAKLKLDIRQFPIEYRPRHGESKLDTWSDGWRHLRFLLIHSPLHLFLLPGALLAGLGVLVMAGVLAHVTVLGHQWDIHTLIGGSLLLILGTQVAALGLCALTYGVYFMGEENP
ncbi:MAG: glycosyltransferase family 2 protein, partial [Solirubrobacterales bacterium]